MAGSLPYFSFKQKMKLARSGLFKSNPIYVQFYITARCDLSCEQCNICYAQADAPEVSIKHIEAIARNLAAIGTSVVLLIGGEPFIRTDIIRIVTAFIKEGIHVRLQTNGIASRNALEQCVAQGAHDISVSLDSLDESSQNMINGMMEHSWRRSLETVCVINDIFPKNTTAFFGTVLMPQNINEIPNILAFATDIGWGISLVPVHTTTMNYPRGFCAYAENDQFMFSEKDMNDTYTCIETLKKMKKKGFNLYDSDRYLDDICRFVDNKEMQWRERNDGVCDSPNLYFAIDPSGCLQPCCDYVLKKTFPVYDDKFPEWFQNGEIHNEVFKYTYNCPGCLYGSYPEITLSARYPVVIFERIRYFLKPRGKNELRKISVDEIFKLASYYKGLNI